MATTAGLVLIGDEILAGKFEELNGAFLTRALRERGVRLLRQETVADDVGEIADSVARCARRCDLVFTSGGLGPTHDDVTMAGIARAFDVELIHHPHLRKLARLFLGGDPTPTQLRLCEVPAGAEVHATDERTWPLIQFRNVYILPGVPSLFRRCFDIASAALLGVPVLEARIHCNADELAIAAELTAIATEQPARLGSYPRFENGRQKVVITVESTQMRDIEAALAALERAFGDLITERELPEAAQ